MNIYYLRTTVILTVLLVSFATLNGNGVALFAQPSGEIDYPIAVPSPANMTENEIGSVEQSIPIVNTTASMWNNGEPEL